MSLEGLPGGALVARGLTDLAAGRDSVEALLVRIARTRLTEAGLAVPEAGDGGDLELRLYAQLGEALGDAAYGRYQSLLRELDSCARALERERGARLRAARST